MTDDREYRDEISLLDLLVTVAENWLLLLVVPVLAGIVAYAFFALQPQSWHSSAIVGLPQAEVSRHLQVVLDDQTGPLAGTGVAVAEIERGLSTSEGADAMRTRLGLSLVEPGNVEAALTALLGRLAEAVDNGEIITPHTNIIVEMDALTEDIALRERVIGNLVQTLDGMEAGGAFEDQDYVQTAATLNELLLGRDAQRARHDELATRLAALPDSVIEEGPSPPERVGRSPFLIAGLTVLGTGFVLLVLVFVRSGLRNAAADPENRGKIDRIRRAFGLGPLRLEP